MNLSFYYLDNFDLPSIEASVNLSSSELDLYVGPSLTWLSEVIPQLL